MHVCTDAYICISAAIACLVGVFCSDLRPCACLDSRPVCIHCFALPHVLVQRIA